MNPSISSQAGRKSKLSKENKSAVVEISKGTQSIISKALRARHALLPPTKRGFSLSIVGEFEAPLEKKSLKRINMSLSTNILLIQETMCPREFVTKKNSP
jgi:hypothetical protein